MVSLKDAACHFDRSKRSDSPNSWMLCQAGASVLCKKTGERYKVVDNWDDANCSMTVSPKRLIAFSTWPGEGCEEMNIGLCQFPKTFTHPNGQRLPVKQSKQWSWHSFCKTQYANNPAAGGLANFLRCHLCVVALLDAAKAEGFALEVSDEGDYWEKRNVQALGNEVGEWDVMIASFGAALAGALNTPETGLSVQSTIEEYANFDDLVARGAKTSDIQAATMVEVIKRLVQLTNARVVEEVPA